MEYVRIGEIINTFGIKGELKVRSFSDFEKERYAIGSTVYITDDYLPVKVHSFKHHKGFTLVSFEDMLDINLVEKYKNQTIYKAKDDIKPLEKGKYYFSDLRGLKIVINNEVVGECIDVEEGLRNNFLRVLKDGKEHLIPFIPAFIKNVDLEKQEIEVVEMEGLL